MHLCNENHECHACFEVFKTQNIFFKKFLIFLIFQKFEKSGMLQRTHSKSKNFLEEYIFYVLKFFKTSMAFMFSLHLCICAFVLLVL